MTLSKFLLTIPVTVVVLTSQSQADPPSAFLTKWRGSCYNCVNYAFDDKSTYWVDFPKQPGGFNCVNLTAYVTAAPPAGLGLVPAPPVVPPALVPVCPAGQCIVALFSHGPVPPAMPEGDYHFVRRNGNATWSHKYGSRRAINVDSAGVPMTDTQNPPHTALIEHVVPTAGGPITVPYQFCGYFCIPVAPTFPFRGPWNQTESFRWWSIQHSGVEDSSGELNSVETTLLHLPDTTTAISPPGWASTGESGGFGLAPGPQVMGSPPYMRVYDGVVAYYSDLAADEIEITYYADNNGLESYLETESGLELVHTLSGWVTVVMLMLIVGTGGALLHRRTARNKSTLTGSF